jgi:ankyrin repeat protein
MTTIHLQLVQCCSDIDNASNDQLSQLTDLLNQIQRADQRYVIDIEDATHRAPLFYAIEMGKSTDFLRLLLDFPARLTEKILLAAIRYGNLEILELLHKHGADFRQTSHGLSLLHECILLHKNHLIRFMVETAGVSRAKEKSN